MRKVWLWLWRHGGYKLARPFPKAERWLWERTLPLFARKIEQSKR